MSSRKRPASESVGSDASETAEPMGAAAASTSATAEAEIVRITFKDVLNNSVSGSHATAKRLKSEVLTQVPIDIGSLDLRLEFVRLALAAHSALSVGTQPYGCPSGNLADLIRTARQLQNHQTR